jgi:ATP-dependent protease ClpP protease subunit
MNEIVLYGTVGASFWDEEYFTAKMVREMLDGRTGPLTVRLNSPGGVASEGQAIYTMLRDYDGEVEVVVDAVAMSAASLLAMAGDKITMRRGSYMLIHDPAMLFAEGRGTAEDHKKTATFLDKIADAYADVYASRTGLAKDEARRVMRDETVYTAEEAVAAGFATDTDDDEAVEAAAFDYRVYANAPEFLRGKSRGRVPEYAAVAAMIGGFPRQAKEADMADDTKAVKPEAADDDEDKKMAVKAEDGTQEGEEDDAPDGKAKASAPRVEMSARQTARLYDTAEMAGVNVSFVSEMIEAGVDFEGALTRITSEWKKAGDKDIAMHGRETTRILRDERETSRAGMEAAIVAQLSRRDPESDVARPYMGMSLVEMAANSVGYKGSLRSAGDREQAFMAGTHSTSDFPAVFSNALNKMLEARYRDATPTYRDVARRMTFNDFRPHPVIGVGTFPEMGEVLEGGEIKYGTFGEKSESVAVKPYAVAVNITRQMIVNDEMDAIAQIIADRGRAVARFEDKVFYTMLLSGSNADGPTLTETTRQVFNTTDLSKAGSAAAITVTSLSVGRASLRKRVGIDGEKLNIPASILLVGPDKETEAQQIVAPIQAQSAGNVNPFAGTLRVVSTPYLTGNSWYLFADPADVPCFIYGFLSGFEGPRMRMEEPFGRQGVSMSLEHDFGVGAVDHRGGYKNAGA